MRTGERLSEHSRLANELYDMHFLYRVPKGLELSGVLALGLFVLLVTGFVIHVKNLWRQWWQFRPTLRWRFTASDAHKVLGVFGAPLAFMFAWSGCILGLAPLLIPAMAGAVYDGNEGKVSSLYYGPELERVASESSAARTREASVRLSFDALVDKARAALPGSQAVERVEGDHFGKDVAFVRVGFVREGLDEERTVVLDSATGNVLATPTEESSASSRFNSVMFDLHFANYGGFALRAVYALLALFVCVVIVTGNLVWLERRDPGRRHRGNRLLERGTLGAICGTNLATAAYFFTNRVLPDGASGRAVLEFQIFLGIWLMSILVSFVAFREPRWLGARMCMMAGVLLVLVVLGDVARVDWRSLGAGGEQGAVLACDALLLLVVSASFAGAWFLRGAHSSRVPEVEPTSNVTSG
jgi:hypothetical protein